MARRWKRVLRALAVAAVVVSTAVTAAPDPASAYVPSCQISDPLAGATVSGTSVPVKAIVPWGTTGTSFTLDGQPMGRGYDANWRRNYTAMGTNVQGWASTAVTNGTHTISCVSWGPDGVSPPSPTVTFTTSNPVRTRLTTPADGAAVSGSAVTLTLDTWVASGTNPTTATFLIDDVVVGTGSCTWWLCTFPWDSTSVSDGLHVVTARGTGSNGAPGWSAPRRVFVNNGAPANPLLLSSYEADGWGQVHRDGGFSRQLPGDPTKSLFTFGDGGFTPGTGPQKGQDQWRFGNSSAYATVSPGSAPGPLREIPNPTSDPSPSLPSPNLIPPSPNMKDADGSSCDTGAAWTTGATVKPGTDHLLISYVSYCNHGGTFVMQVWGLADFDPATATAVPHDVFVAATTSGLDPQLQLASPTFDTNYLYLWRGAVGSIYQARVPLNPSVGHPTPWFEPGLYEWKSFWSGTGWTYTHSLATSATPLFVGSNNSQVSVDRYGSVPGSPHLMIVPDPSSVNKVDVYRSPTNLGPWTKVVDDLIPCSRCVTAGTAIYSVNGHPEFSTAGSIAITYFDVATNRIHSTSFPTPP